MTVSMHQSLQKVLKILLLLYRAVFNSGNGMHVGYTFNEHFSRMVILEEILTD